MPPECKGNCLTVQKAKYKIYIGYCATCQCFVKMNLRKRCRCCKQQVRTKSRKKRSKKIEA